MCFLSAGLRTFIFSCKNIFIDIKLDEFSILYMLIFIRNEKTKAVVTTTCHGNLLYFLIILSYVYVVGHLYKAEGSLSPFVRVLRMHAARTGCLSLDSIG